MILKKEERLFQVLPLSHTMASGAVPPPPIVVDNSARDSHHVFMQIIKAGIPTAPCWKKSSTRIDNRIMLSQSAQISNWDHLG